LVRLVLKFVMQNDGDFVDVILLYQRVVNYQVGSYGKKNCDDEKWKKLA
jgi:hypothetical protein